MDRKKRTLLSNECNPDQVIHPRGSTEFCPDNPEQYIFFYRED